jgi:hypothetical protein
VGGASLALHRTLAPGDTALWLASDDERAAIAGPLSRIMARRVPVSGGAASDLADVLEASVAIGGFTVRNLIDAADARATAYDEQPRTGPIVEHLR